MKKIIDFLGSVRLAIPLFLILAFLSIFGTIIPQGQPAQFYIAKYGEKFGRFIITFTLDDAYHSWWYIGTLILFLINLTICSLKRLPFTLKLYKKSPEDIDPEKLPNQEKTCINGDIERISEIVSKKLGFKKSGREFNNGILFFKDQNRWAHFAVYVVHFSLIVVVIGAIIGAVLGYRGNMAIMEGGISNQVIPFRNREPIFLNFSLKLNKFILELYPDGTPKEYISNVTVIDKNKRFNALIKVNKPLRYKGLSFYQASYQEIPEFKIKVDYRGKSKIYTLSSFEPAVIDDRYSVILNDYGRAHGFLYARIDFFDQKTKREISGMLISGFPHFRIPLDKGMLSITLLGIKKLDYLTVLQVTKDPGVPIVYVGFILIMLGLLGVYFFEPRVYWIFLSPEGNEICVRAGAYAKRDREEVKECIKKFLENIKISL